VKDLVLFLVGLHIGLVPEENIVVFQFQRVDQELRLFWVSIIREILFFCPLFALNRGFSRAHAFFKIKY